MSSGLPLATINLNIGRGNNNPRLVVMPGDNVQQLVGDIVKEYALPQQAYQVIMQRVTQELPNALQLSPHQQRKSIAKDTSKTKSRTPQAQHSRTKISLKENLPVDINKPTDSNKVHARKRSVSPVLRKQNPTTPTLKKIELKPSKSPFKGEKKDSRKSKLNDCPKTTALHRLFRQLTKDNPKGIERVSPEHINLNSLPQTLLGHLQSFFEKLEDSEFDSLTEAAFMKRVEELGFSSRLSVSYQ